MGMSFERGDVVWVNLTDDPRGSEPAFRRPGVVVQANAFNDSAIATVIVVAVTSNTALAQYPGNVFLPASATGLPFDSVANVTQIVTEPLVAVDRHPVAILPPRFMAEIDRGLSLVLGLMPIRSADMGR
jgi:mRNA interferase MazF